MKGTYNKPRGEQLGQAIEKHLRDPNTKIIKGTFKGKKVIHHINTETKIDVMTWPNGEILSGWKLGPLQFKNVITRGSL